VRLITFHISGRQAGDLHPVSGRDLAAGRDRISGGHGNHTCRLNKPIDSRRPELAPVTSGFDLLTVGPGPGPGPDKATPVL